MRTKELNILLCQLLENSPDPNYTLDKEFRFTYLNKAAEKLLGKDRTNLLGKNVWQEFPEALSLQLYHHYHKAMSEQFAVKFEEFCSLTNSWFEIHALPFNGGLAVHFRDVTEQKTTEQKLRKSEKRYRQLVELSPIATAVQLNEKWFYVNPAAIKLFGATKLDDLVGKPIYDFIHPDFHSLVKGRVKKLAEERTRLPIIEQKFIRLDGQVIDVEIEATPIVFQDTPGSQIIIKDITQRKKYERELKEGEGFLASVFSSIQDGLAVIDKDLNIVRVNPTMEKWYNYAMPLVGKKCYQVYKGDSTQCPNCPLSYIPNLDSATCNNIPKLGPDGKAIGWLEINNFPLTATSNQQVKGIIKHARDVTEKIRVEQEMARFESLNLVGEIAASIGHEVRNPMTTVRGFLQLFKNKVEFTNYQDQIDLLIDELDRANSIISEFLSLAKNRNISFKIQNLNTIIEALFPLIKADAMVMEKGVMLSLEEVPDLPLNEKEIRQLILNLVRNGLEAMTSGGHLIIRTYRRGDNVILSIKDHGKGIEPELINKLGTPFLTTKEKGTGLGLAVCYSIAARHKAKIKFKTGFTGTTFYIHFKNNQA